MIDFSAFSIESGPKLYLSRLKFWGHLIGAADISPSSAKTEAIQQFPMTTNMRHDKTDALYLIV